MAIPGPSSSAVRMEREKAVAWARREIVPLTPRRSSLEDSGHEPCDVVSKEELMSRFWPDAAVEDAESTVTVGRSAERIDPHPAGDPVRGGGCRAGFAFGAAFCGRRASGPRSDWRRPSSASAPKPGCTSHRQDDAIIGVSGR